MKKRFSLINTALFLVMSLSFVSALTRSPQAAPGRHAARGVFNRPEIVEAEEEAEVVKSGFFRIPLPEGTEESSVKVTEDLFNKKILIEISGVDDAFFKNNAFSGDISGIADVKYGYYGGVSTVELDTETVSVYESEFTENSFYLRVSDIHDVYEKVIAIDAGHCGDDTGSVVYGVEEKNITSGVAGLLKDKLSSENYYVILTASAEENRSEEERAEIVNLCKADLLITLHTGADPDTRVTNGVEAGCSNGLRDLCKHVTRRISKACSEKDLGIKDIRYPGVTKYTRVPFILLKLGYITNRKEAENMNSPDYRERAAEAIKEAVTEWFDAEKNG